MVFSLTVFRDIVAAAGGSWETMKQFLTSAEGGRLHIVDSACGRYAIIHYVKGTSNMDLPHVRWFRSVVWDTRNMVPLSVAPPKASGDIGSVPATGLVQAQEYIDGINLNIYMSAEDKVFQLATRSSFGAKGRFYSKRSFAELFQHALFAAPPEVKAVFDVEQGRPVAGEVSRFISVLIQHPEHRIVEPVTAPRLWILHLGIVRADGEVIIKEDVCNIPTCDVPVEGETAEKWFERISEGRDWKWRGAVLKDGAGGRWRAKFQPYQMVRFLRGNCSRASERFFSLRAVGFVQTYLEYYPEDLALYTEYEKWMHASMTELYYHYVKLNIQRSVGVETIPSYWYTHLGALYKKHKSRLTIGHVVEYMSMLPVPRLMFLLRASGGPGSASAASASP
jgi:hypothetical protein